MIFYLVLGVLFSIYALDLLFLVVVSIIARAREEPLPTFDEERVRKVWHCGPAWACGRDHQHAGVSCWMRP